MSDTFSNGLMLMANYFGNVILPIIAGLIICLGIYAFSQQKSGTHYIQAALACLLASGFLREAEFFFGTTTDSTMFYTGLLGLVNWVGNVIMPLYAVWCFARAVMAYSGIFDRHGQTSAKMLMVSGIGCLAVSGILRMLEYFVVQGAAKGGLF
jgi:hypothetical protein